MSTPLSPTRRRFLGPLAAGCFLALAGCNLLPPPQPDPTHYYVITGPGLGDGTAVRPGGKLRLGLKTVELPAYLRKGTLAVRRGNNELRYDEYARWAEPLETGLTRALRAHLLAVPSVTRVYAQPYPGDQERDYDIAVTLIRCEGTLDSAGRAAVSFAAVLEISGVKNPGLVVTRKIYAPPPASWDGKDYGALAQSLSETVGALSQEIAAVLPDKD